ncbi:endonuclease/exonuclease/phosphatase family protein [Rhodopirellula maiorica SM1]|uniref:Endonuclease/exonuclease/phosphatase family protein n=1 Tax=Rhodopirellula maiorica SM1 TaxID=1265738 RepID=M5RG59_9BACT|nr:endonuclease/exonuclease/phosphatase family protein [Rhodopirellula maiorica]EMI18131.1 endonuclease/exonuclease/phosphatase family protein [Rhodopirellula maiorica SM1]
MKIACLSLLACLIASPAFADEMTRLMTYNIRYLNPNDGPDHWDQRVDAVAETIKRADIIGLQEATRKQIDDLADRLPEFHWYGVGRSDGRDGGEFSPVFWRRDQFDVIRKGTFWLGPDPQAVGENAWGANLPRICSWVEIKSKNEATHLLLMNTHFDHQSATARENSANLLRTKASELRGQLPVVMMGDLNATPESKPLQNLLAKNGEGVTFFDASKLSDSEPTGPSGTFNGFKAVREKFKIDFILLSDPKTAVASHQTLDPKTKAGRFASDHLPILINVAPRAAKTKANR